MPNGVTIVIPNVNSEIKTDYKNSPGLEFWSELVQL